MKEAGLALLALSSLARAEVPDATLRAVGERPIVVETIAGPVRGTIVAFDEDTMTVSGPGGEVGVVRRGDALALRLPPEVGRPPIREEPPPPPSNRERHFAIGLMLTPGIVVDVDYRNVHAFASFSPLPTLASSGTQGGFAVGAGPSIALLGRLRVDLFAIVTPLLSHQCETTGGVGSGFGTATYCLDANYVGLGVGVGAHYTSPRGWTVGIKAPFLGVAPGDARTVGDATAHFYLAALCSLPMLSFGYRL